MKKKWALMLLLAVFLLGGCLKSEPVAVEDPEELEKIWHEYVFYGITTLYNHDFQDVEELPKPQVVQFILFQMAANNELEPSLGPWSDMRYYKIPSQEDFNRKTEEYFGKELAYDPFLLSEAYAFEEETASFPFSDSYSSYDEKNAWGLVLGDVFYDAHEKQYEVMINHYADREQSRINRITHIIMQEDDHGNIYIKSCFREYPETDFVKIEGNAVELEYEIFREDAEKPYYPMSGYDLGEKILVVERAAYEGVDPNMTLYLFDPATAKVETVRFYEGGDIRVKGEQVIIKRDKDFTVLDENIKELIGGDVPPGIAMATKISSQRFFGYDISADGSQIVYSNEEGLFLYDLEVGSIVKIQDVIENENKKFSQYTYVLRPHFTPEEDMVVGVLSGYEGLEGIIAVGTEAGYGSYVQLGTQNGYSLDGDNIASVFPELIYDYDKKRFQLQLVDFKEKIVDPDAEFSSYDIFRGNPIFTDGPGKNTEFNDRYLAYVSSDIYDIYEDPERNVEEAQWKIILVDLETMESSVLGVITAGRPELLAVTKTGDVLAEYSFEREKGFVLFKNEGKE